MYALHTVCAVSALHGYCHSCYGPLFFGQVSNASHIAGEINQTKKNKITKII